ncbi:MAG: F0F1 ATP synthase subunit A [Firmicutes bacterium]|nr:F0F1 ATP synthase subunit A [Bacillota bacterium]
MFEVALFPAPVEFTLAGHTLRLSATALTTWWILAVVLALALAFRLILVPRLKENPKGLQRALEAAIENLDNYIGGRLHGAGEAFGAYIFSLALMLICCAFVELLGLRPPTSDFTMTLALSVMTLVLVNICGFKRRGFKGRLKSFKNPFLLLSDIITPVSMACRLFGNMFAGMIIVDLMYFLLKNFAVGLPGVVGLYFNVFHPLIQAFIFITLTLSNVAEASEPVES